MDSVNAPSDSQLEQVGKALSPLRHWMLRCRGLRSARRQIVQTALPLQADAPCRREADHSGRAIRERLQPSVPRPGLVRGRHRRFVGMIGRPGRRGDVRLEPSFTFLHNGALLVAGCLKPTSVCYRTVPNLKCSGECGWPLWILGIARTALGLGPRKPSCQVANRPSF